MDDNYRAAVDAAAIFSETDLRGCITYVNQQFCSISGYSRDIWGKNPLGLRRNSWDRMKMDVCAECHAGAHVNPGSVQTQRDGCLVCHK